MADKMVIKSNVVLIVITNFLILYEPYTVEHGYKDMLGILKICPYSRVVLISVVFQKSPSLTFSAL